MVGSLYARQWCIHAFHIPVVPIRLAAEEALPPKMADQTDQVLQ